MNPWVHFSLTLTNAICSNTVGMETLCGKVRPCAGFSSRESTKTLLQKAHMQRKHTVTAAPPPPSVTRQQGRAPGGRAKVLKVLYMK